MKEIEKFFTLLNLSLQFLVTYFHEIITWSRVVLSEVFPPYTFLALLCSSWKENSSDFSLCFHMYALLMQGSFTGPRIFWSGSSLRTEATGYGLVI